MVINVHTQLSRAICSHKLFAAPMTKFWFRFLENFDDNYSCSRVSATKMSIARAEMLQTTGKHGAPEICALFSCTGRSASLQRIWLAFFACPGSGPRGLRRSAVSTASRRTRLSPPCASNSGALGGSPSMEVFHPSRSPRFPDIWIHPGIKCKEPPTHRGRACAHIARRLASLTGTG